MPSGSTAHRGDGDHAAGGGSVEAELNGCIKEVCVQFKKIQFKCQNFPCFLLILVLELYQVASDGIPLSNTVRWWDVVDD